MMLEVEVTQDGLLRVAPGEKIPSGKLILSVKPSVREPLIGDGSWKYIEEVFRKADQLDFPRRTHEEILRDLHAFRGRE